jgi:hypothetical protein
MQIAASMYKAAMNENTDTHLMLMKRNCMERTRFLYDEYRDFKLKTPNPLLRWFYNGQSPPLSQLVRAIPHINSDPDTQYVWRGHKYCYDTAAYNPINKDRVIQKLPFPIRLKHVTICSASPDMRRAEFVFEDKYNQDELHCRPAYLELDSGHYYTLAATHHDCM